MTVTMLAHDKRMEVCITPTTVKARYEGDKAWTKINGRDIANEIRKTANELFGAMNKKEQKNEHN